MAISDYRWTLQEDLTFKHDISGTPPVDTRTVGTSFHRSHMTLVATGRVGPVSCGSGQSVLDPVTKQQYDRDPRYIARKAELYLTSSGIADTASPPIPGTVPRLPQVLPVKWPRRRAYRCPANWSPPRTARRRSS